jgi:hypothetical protein
VDGVDATQAFQRSFSAATGRVAARRLKCGITGSRLGGNSVKVWMKELIVIVGQGIGFPCVDFWRSGARMSMVRSLSPLRVPSPALGDNDMADGDNGF